MPSTPARNLGLALVCLGARLIYLGFYFQVVQRVPLLILFVLAGMLAMVKGVNLVRSGPPGE